MFHLHLLLPKNLFFLPSRRSFSSSQVRRLLLTPFSRFQIREFSSSQSDWNCSSRNVPVSVWWDMDNCGVPSGVSILKVAPSIMAAVRANGIKGRIQIFAYGDLPSSEVDYHALFLTHIKAIGNSFGEKNGAYRAIIRDLHYWVSNNPPPAHLFLILGDRDDRDLSGMLHRLRMKNYNILIASSSGRASDTLCSATTIMWQWSSMLKGENVTGKHFNYPLGNPFSATQEPKYSQNAKIQKPFSGIKGSELRRLLLTPLPRIQICDSSSPTPKHRRWKCIDEDEYTLRVSVVWDFETCGVPSGVSYSKVAPSITGALRTEGFKGPIHIEAYGNVYQLSEINQKILFSTGIDLHHIPGGKTNSNGFLVDWISQKTSQRAHLMLISGDRDDGFVFTVNRLSFSNYIILVACPGRADHYIRRASTIMWQWSKLLEGEFLENHEHLHDDF